MSEFYTKLLDKALEQKKPVIIFCAEKFENKPWAIAIEEDKDFWLDIFLLKKDAITFCKENKIPFKVITRKTHRKYKEYQKWLSIKDIEKELEEIEKIKDKLKDEAKIY